MEKAKEHLYRLLLLALLGFLLLHLGCGKKGPPVPPPETAASSLVSDAKSEPLEADTHRRLMHL